MSKRVIIGTAPSIEVARMYEQMFRDANIPVTAMMVESGVEMYTPGAVAELWLEDDSLLNDPELRAAIREVLHSPERGPSIEMPMLIPETEPEHPPTVGWPISWWILITVGTIAFVVLLAWQFFNVAEAVVP